MITAAAVAAMALGVFLVLRAVAIVATGTTGRFALDPWLSLLGGFALILLGQIALRTSA